MKGAAVAGLLVVAIVIGAGAGYLVGSSTHQNTSPTSTAIPITLPSYVCTSPTPRDNQTGTTEVYQLSLYSIGVICVTYQFKGNGSYSFSPAVFGPQPGSSGTWVACVAKAGSSVPADCSDMTITPYQPSINHLSSQNVTVAYTVQTFGGPGLFWFSIGSCGPIPIAIGEKPSYVVPPGFGCVTTPGDPTSVTVVGTWNINVTEASDHSPLP